MPYRPDRPTLAQSRSAALLRVAASADHVTDLRKPPLGFKIAVSVARECKAGWAEIAALTPYTATELKEMV